MPKGDALVSFLKPGALGGVEGYGDASGVWLIEVVMGRNVVEWY